MYMQWKNSATHIACYQFRLYLFPDCYTCTCSGKTVLHTQLVIGLDFIYSLTATHVHAVEKQPHTYSLLLVQTLFIPCLLHMYMQQKNSVTHIACYQFSLYLFPDYYTCTCSGKTVPHTQLVISLDFIYSLTATHVHAVEKQCHSHSLLLVQTLFIPWLLHMYMQWKNSASHIACYQFRLYLYPDYYTCTCSGRTVPHTQLVISLDYNYFLTATHVHAEEKQCHTHNLL